MMFDKRGIQENTENCRKELDINSGVKIYNTWNKNKFTRGI